MKKIKCLVLICALFTITSCSVYKSSGRKSFEGDSSGKISHVASSSEKNARHQENLTDDTCWTQPSNEPLWQIDDSAPMTVTKISDDEVQICTSQP
jgi:hypothetical protein